MFKYKKKKLEKSSVHQQNPYPKHTSIEPVSATSVLSGDIDNKSIKKI